MSSVTDRRGVLSAQRRRDRLVRGRPRLLFLTPAVVLVGLLALLPFALTVGRSFLDDAVVDPSFAGLSSYARLVTDPVIVRLMTLAEIPQLCSPKFPSLGRSVA
ncbi:hypothetical protein PQI65_16210 [Brachybacterium paraconglomeratum]